MVENEMTWQNPFEKSLWEDWRVREYPENYVDGVKCFISPEFMSLLEGLDIKPKIIMGGRGTGKSHILNMLSIQSVVTQIRIDKAKDEGKEPEEVKLNLGDYEKSFFGINLEGFYFHFLSRTDITYLSEEQLRTLFEHMFNMDVCSKIIEGIKYVMENFEDIPAGIEGKICKEIRWKIPSIIKGETFEDVEASFQAQIDAIAQIVREWAWYKDFDRFKDKIDFTQSPDFIVDFIGIIQKEILQNKIFFILIDEYDELDTYQQRFINKLIRSRKISFKIASAIGGIKTFEYAPGKELQEINDYDPIIPLHFEISPSEKTSYRNLLKNIFIKRLSTFGNYKINDPETILQSPTLKDMGIINEEYKNELQTIRNTLKRKKEIKDSTKYWQIFEGHYKEAAIYRVLRRKGKDKLFAGFNEYVTLSSGIIRQFILLCRNVFSLAHTRNIHIEEGNPIPFRIQSEAAEGVAKELLENEYRRDSPKGIELKQLVYDLGRILEYKVYKSTEPQSNQFEIRDCLKFSEPEYKNARDTIEEGLKLPHFLAKVAFRPKQPISSISSFVFSLNNIFTPILKIPPQKRWRFPVYSEELKGLCSIGHEQTLKKIIWRMKGEKKEIPFRTTLFEREITLSNCPLTGKGCRENIIQYFIPPHKKAFLAIPFKRDWTDDPRKWIKSIMSDDFKILCRDVDDFPQVGFVLCKICSCIRQMPIGLFEITELNPNVIFELGMATALNKINYMLVYKEKIQPELREKYPPKPLSGIEYVPYELNKNAVYQAIHMKIIPLIEEAYKHEEREQCWLIRGKCSHQTIANQSNKIFIGLPYNKNQQFFEEVENSMKNIFVESKIKNVNFFKPSQSLDELCQLCKEVGESSFCIIDTSYNDYSMLFSLGVAFGKDKKFIQTHNKSLSGVERPISDLRNWAIEYNNTSELEKSLRNELPKRLEG